MRVKLIKPYCGYIPGDTIGISGRRGRLLVAAGIGLSLSTDEKVEHNADEDIRQPAVPEAPKIENAESRKARGRKKAIKK